MDTKKRRLIIGTATSAPILVLANRPVMATTCTPSGYMSAKVGSSLHPDFDEEMCEDSKNYFTFKDEQVDKYGVSLKDSFVIIVAKDKVEAVEIMTTSITPSWEGHYTNFSDLPPNYFIEVEPERVALYP